MTAKITNSQHIDPVCGMKVSSNNTVTVSPYAIGPCTYYFCAKACRDAFIADPDKYLKGNSPKRKGWWARYLERLAKANGGRPLSCH